MIAFPAAASLIAFVCAIVVGLDAVKRPRPERAAWTIAFLLFALAAGAEVVGSLLGWNPALARIYYLAGAVLVVGFLALGELYLLLPGRMPAITPGLTLLVVAFAATAVWSAAIDPELLAIEGWDAIERGPALVAVAVMTNGLGTLVLVGGALYSAWRMRGTPALANRAWGCLLIALGAILIASGGTLTRFGFREYLYLAMAAGIAVIFAGVLLTRRPVPRTAAPALPQSGGAAPGFAPVRGELVPLPARATAERNAPGLEGVRFICTALLPMENYELARVCERWSASPVPTDILTRAQAKQVWALRRVLPDESKARFDRAPTGVQAQLAELYAEVWSHDPAGVPRQHERRA
jgi:energy-converting hydrogenase Eha subunit A